MLGKSGGGGSGILSVGSLGLSSGTVEVSLWIGVCITVQISLLIVTIGSILEFGEYV